MVLQVFEEELLVVLVAAEDVSLDAEDEYLRLRQYRMRPRRPASRITPQITTAISSGNGNGMPARLKT